MTNTGTAPADNIQLSGNAPTGWKIAFEPKTIDRIAPNEHKEVQALISPPGKAIAGDYVTTLTASTRGETGTREFPRHRDDFDHVGDCRHRHHRCRAADHGGRRRTVRPAMSEIVIEAKGLTKRYGAAFAVNDVTFTVDAGEIFGLLGPNGAGKTTTILMLLGLSDISAGQARVFGHDPMREPLAVKRQVGYLPDSVGFYDYLTAADNLHYTARLMGITAGVREKRIAAALARVGLSAVANKKVAHLLARHAPAAGARRNRDEGRPHRHPGRADQRARPAGQRSSCWS